MAGNRLATGNKNCAGLVQRQYQFDIANIDGAFEKEARYDHCPFQAFSELLRADAPFFKRRRRCHSNLNDGPVSNQCSGDVSIRQRTAHDEMVVAMHEHAYYVICCGSLDTVTRGSGTG